MRMMLTALAALGLATGAGAQTAAAPCARQAAPFSQADMVDAASRPDAAPVLAVGTPLQPMLVPVSTVTLAAPLGKPAAAGDKGGLLGLHIASAGTYRIALGGKAWIDVVKDGKPLPSVAHGHGEPCSGIAKQVDFALQPGDYLLQLSDTTQSMLGVLVTRLP